MMRALGANAVLVDQVEGKPGNVCLPCKIVSLANFKSMS